MQTQGGVQLLHQGVRQRSDPLAQTLDGYRSHLFRLRLGIARQARGAGIKRWPPPRAPHRWGA